MRQWLLQPPSADDLIRLLTAWRLWLVSAIVGATLGAGVYSAAPPPYRAQATVVVDQNLEQAYPTQPDREVFYYLARETLKLEEVAFSDDVIEAVSEQVPGFSVADLRGGKLKLGQPGDGPWHFWAEDPNPQKAQALAEAWARAFAKYAHQAVDAARALSTPPTAAADPTLEAQAKGVSAYIAVSVSEGQRLPVERAANMGVYIFMGSVAAAVLAALGVLFSYGEKHAS